jgi:hypothetical protein
VIFGLVVVGRLWVESRGEWKLPGGAVGVRCFPQVGSAAECIWSIPEGAVSEYAVCVLPRGEGMGEIMVHVSVSV